MQNKFALTSNTKQIQTGNINLFDAIGLLTTRMIPLTANQITAILNIVNTDPQYSSYIPQLAGITPDNSTNYYNPLQSLSSVENFINIAKGIIFPAYKVGIQIQALISFVTLDGAGSTVNAGDLGGYVESANNLMQTGTSWIADDAFCCESSQIQQDGLIDKNVLVMGNSAIYGNHHATGNVIFRDTTYGSGGLSQDTVQFTENSGIISGIASGNTIYSGTQVVSANK